MGSPPADLAPGIEDPGIPGRTKSDIEKKLKLLIISSKRLRYIQSSRLILLFVGCDEYFSQ